MRYLINFSYDGTNFKGFQKQKGLRTVQEEIENALFFINNKRKTNIVASGRTDKGVHANNQYAHADIDVDITEKKLKRALNSNLEDDIYVKNVEIVDEYFHARYDVTKKEYYYIINIGEYNPLERNYVFQYNYKLDIDSMKKAIKYFIGRHDFRAFVTDNKEKLNCIRTIENARLYLDNNKIYIFFLGDGFLRYQVRNMVGVLIKVGENKIKPEEIAKIIDSKDRTKAGKTAPAMGLYLNNVFYDKKKQ